MRESSKQSDKQRNKKISIIMYYSLIVIVIRFSDEMSMSTATMTSSSTTMPLLPVAVELCAGCRLPIEDRFLLRVMDNSWHERCLQCSVCCEPLRQSCFVKDRRLLCRQDYDKCVIRSMFLCVFMLRRHVSGVFTALHGMQTRSSDENSVCPSVSLSHA